MTRRLSRVQVVVLVLLMAMAVYFFLLAQRAAFLVEDPNPVSKTLGVVVIVFPLIGIYVVVQEVRFGAASGRVARLLDPELRDHDEAEVAALPRSPSGRIPRAAADELFVRRQHDVEAAPSDAAQWYRLAVAYDLAGDRRRARRAMRSAIALLPR